VPVITPEEAPFPPVIYVVNDGLVPFPDGFTSNPLNAMIVPHLFYFLGRSVRYAGDDPVICLVMTDTSFLTIMSAIAAIQAQFHDTPLFIHGLLSIAPSGQDMLADFVYFPRHGSNGACPDVPPSVLAKFKLLVNPATVVPPGPAGPDWHRRVKQADRVTVRSPYSDPLKHRLFLDAVMVALNGRPFNTRPRLDSVNSFRLHAAGMTADSWLVRHG